MNENKDWRLQGQERYLKGVTLEFKKYSKYREGWEHDHCEFCQMKFVETGSDTLHEGYVTKDNYHWICPQCFNDFRNLFKWNVA